MKKILIFTPVWGRYEVTKLCYIGLKRFMKTLKDKGLDSEVLIIGSPEDESNHKELAIENGFNYIDIKNYPVGNKHNEGLKYALKNLEWDYLMQISSDNFIRDEYVDYILKPINDNVPMFGLERCALLCSATLRQFSFKVFKDKRIGGVGRLLKRDMLQKTIDAFGFVWEHNKKKGLDWNSESTIFKAQRVKPVIIEVEQDMALDIKSKTNLNSFDGMYKMAIKKYKIAEPMTSFLGFTEEVTLEALKLID